MKKSKFIILGITIAVSIIAIIIILNLSSNVQNAKIEQQEIASSNISEKQIYGTFKTGSMSSFWTQKRVIFTLTFLLFHRVFDILSLNVSFFCYTILL